MSFLPRFLALACKVCCAIPFCVGQPANAPRGETPAAAAAAPDVVIYGATPGGIVTAIRAAREGLRVTLVHHHAHLGGMMSNGLGLFDTLYAGKRAPLYAEVYERIMGRYHARTPAGATPERGYEPHVAEETFEAMIAAEKNITLLREFYPSAAKRNGRQLRTVTFRHMHGDRTVELSAQSFVDASYEGDLAHTAGVETTVGRESRAQYGESHAGKVFTRIEPIPNPSSLTTDGINVRVFGVMANRLLPGSTGEGDKAIQAFNFRVCLTRDPQNRIPVEKPARYEREIYLELRSRWRFTNQLPNQKTSWNAPLLIAGNHDYPTADWPARREIAARHRDLANGLLWFMQHDEAVPAATRAEAREWGLPRDEFRDNGGFPWEMYVREARRLVGRYVFTQHDGMYAAHLRRAPVHADSIAITEWPLDSHSCTLETRADSDHEGKVLLSEETRPGQIPFRSLLPKDLDNLLVTVCLSSSHIGWGTVRLEPALMHLGESAGYALALAHREKIVAAAVPMASLQRALLEAGIMLTFFNDFDMSAPTIAQRAAQYFGTRGFFGSYDAQLSAPLTAGMARLWAQPVTDAMAMARAVHAEERRPAASGVTATEFARLARRPWSNPPQGALSRGQALAWLFAEANPTNVHTPPRGPNVLFVMADDLNDWVGPLGSALAKTPSLDRLAHRGTVFTRAYCSVPSCAPSRTSLLTGIDAPSSGIYFNPQPFRLSTHAISRAVDLPRHFKAAGYLTAGFGKIFHHGRDQEDNKESWTEGYYRGYSAALDATHQKQAVHTQSLDGVWPESWGWYSDDWDKDDPQKMQQDTLNAGEVARLVARRHERPFFIALGIFRPHSKWYVPKRFYDLYPPASLRMPDGCRDGDLDDIPQVGRWLARTNVTPDTYRTLMQRDRWRFAMQAYLASITYADAQLGRVLDALEAGPNNTDTIVIFCSDHGYHLGEKEHWNKFTLWERSARVPLIIALPPKSAAPPSRLESPVSLLDLYPTLIDLAGIGQPASHRLEGVSLRPMLEGRSLSRGAPVLTTYGRGNYAIRDDRWRYIRYRDGGEELYDHADDPHEWNNVAADERSAAIVQRLRAHLPSRAAENSVQPESSRAVFDPPFQALERK